MVSVFGTQTCIGISVVTVLQIYSVFGEIQQTLSLLYYILQGRFNIFSENLGKS